jgi:hypothetical protein
MNTASLYWVRKQEHTDIFSEGYVGVSKNINVRWNRHHKEAISNKHENVFFGSAIKKYGWENLIKEIILVAEETYCYEVEHKLRSKEKIGWNLNCGGSKPPVSKQRGENYVSPLKGKPRPTPWLVGMKRSIEERRKISERKKVKVKYQNVVYESFEDLAKHLNIKYSTLTNRIYRNAKKWGYEVLK